MNVFQNCSVYNKNICKDDGQMYQLFLDLLAFNGITGSFIDDAPKGYFYIDKKLDIRDDFGGEDVQLFSTHFNNMLSVSAYLELGLPVDRVYIAAPIPDERGERIKPLSGNTELTDYRVIFSPVYNDIAGVVNDTIYTYGSYLNEHGELFTLDSIIVKNGNPRFYTGNDEEYFEECYPIDEPLGVVYYKRPPRPSIEEELAEAIAASRGLDAEALKKDPAFMKALSQVDESLKNSNFLKV